MLVAPSTASAVVTIGSDLAPDSGAFFAPCPGGNGCTATHTTLPGQQLSSPIDGVIVRWRARANNTESTPVRLRVIRSGSGGAFTGVNSSATQTIPSTGTTTFTFPTQQPIAAGDRIALDADSPNGNMGIVTADQIGVTYAQWQPPLADGQTRAPDNTVTDSNELLVNADVEPDTDCDGAGDETQDASVQGGCLPAKAADLTSSKAKAKGKNLTLDFACAAGGGDCNDNTVEVETAKKVSLSAAAAAKKKKVVLTTGSFSIPAAQSQEVTLKLTGKGRKLLKKQGKVKTNVTVSTATGSTSSDSLKVNGKRKK